MADKEGKIVKRRPAIQIVSSIGSIDLREKIDIFVEEFEEE